MAKRCHVVFLGIIADDFTGGTDIAGFLVQNGLSVIQYIGIPKGAVAAPPPDAIIISLKSRSSPIDEAVQESLAAQKWLTQQGCKQIFFKYCSTFDSSDRGNIGPVTDALMEATQCDLTVMCPALPINGRTVYNGYLFVGAVPLNESGMQHHPVTPMTDANLMRLTEQQSKGKAGNIPFEIIAQGTEAIKSSLKRLHAEGVRYVVPDILTDQHLIDLAEAVLDFPLVTGGSGLGMGLARTLVKRHALDSHNSMDAGVPPGGKCIVLAGSSSVMTNAQVSYYRDKAPSHKIDVGKCVADVSLYAAEVADWLTSLDVLEQKQAPMIYATSDVNDLQATQKKFGAEISGSAVEQFFSTLAGILRSRGYDHFIVAGGETSGAVVKSLKITAFHIGPQIAPGVPWVRAIEQPVSLALKSGNFGAEDFFSQAQEALP